MTVVVALLRLLLPRPLLDAVAVAVAGDALDVAMAAMPADAVNVSTTHAGLVVVVVDAAAGVGVNDADVPHALALFDVRVATAQHAWRRHVVAIVDDDVAPALGHALLPPRPLAVASAVDVAVVSDDAILVASNRLLMLAPMVS